MNADKENLQTLTPKNLSDVLIRLGLSVLLVVLCFRIFSPFLALMMWALILAIALYPIHQRFAKKVGGQGKASIAIVLLVFLILEVPLGMVALSVVKDSQNSSNAIDERAIVIPVPDPGVSEWPVVGDKIYRAWNEAATNFPQFQEDYQDQLKKVSDTLVAMGFSAISGFLLFTGAFIVAGIIMAFGESGGKSIHQIFVRVCGPERGPELHALSIATVRSVAIGVIGVAFFQSLLFGVGFAFAGIPFPGMLAIAVLLTGIIQLPALLFGIPAIIYIWVGGDSSTVINVVLTVFFVIASISDNILKPLMLGRGVKSPLPVILIGALGGMFTAGFVGLFVGAVILAVGYEVFMGWLKLDSDDMATPEVAEETVPVSE